MKTLFFIIFILINTQFINAQLQGQAKIDSLLKELPKMKEDTNGVNLLNDISFEYRKINPDEGINFGEKGLKISKEIDWKKGIALSYKSLGVNYYKSSKLNKAHSYFEKALRINVEINNIDGIAKNYWNIGNVYRNKSKYSEALDNYFKSIIYFEKIHNKKGISGLYHNIGIVYYYLKNFKKALSYTQKAIDINKEIENIYPLIDLYSLIAALYFEKGDYENSILNLKQATNVSKKIGAKSSEYLILGNMGTIYAKQYKYNEAFEVFFQALKITKEIKIKDKYATILGNIGALYYQLATDTSFANINQETELVSLKKEINLNRSIDYTNQALEIFKEIGDINSISSSLYNISEAYKMKEDHKKALENLEESRIYKDSVFNQENNDKISALEKAREDDVNRLKIEKQEIQLKAQEDERQLIILSAVGALFSVLIILSVIINQRRKSEKLLLNVLPEKIAKRLKAKEHPIADHFDNASIIFIDIVGFTSLSSDANPKRIVSVLNDIFTIFDKLADKHGLEKIKTIGDAYMAVAGIPEIQTDHAKRTALMALDIKHEMKDFKTSDGTEIKFRIGIDCGAVVAGVIGEKKFIYDLWSDAVNTASRMESTGEKGQIQITENFKEELEKYDGDWNFTFRGEFEIKGKGLMKTYFLAENNLGEL